MTAIPQPGYSDATLGENNDEYHNLVPSLPIYSYPPPPPPRIDPGRPTETLSQWLGGGGGGVFDKFGGFYSGRTKVEEGDRVRDNI